MQIKTFTANIYVGLKEGYEGQTFPITRVHDICQSYCDSIGLGVTVTPTKVIYTCGREDGAIVGLINYPRFPSKEETIRELAVNLASLLKYELKQERVSIVFPDYTVMLGNP